MEMNELHPNEGSRSSRMRKGRGRSAGKGKTSGRGQKGQKARGSTRLGFEGGQMPLYRRLPKRGFTNINRKDYTIVDISKLNNFKDGSTVTPEDLVKEGIIKNTKNDVKILGNDKLSKKLTVKAQKFSKGAKEIINNAGGKTEVI